MIFKRKSIATIQTVHAIRLIDRVLFGIVHSYKSHKTYTDCAHDISTDLEQINHPAKRQNCNPFYLILFRFAFVFVFVLTNNDILDILYSIMLSSKLSEVCIHSFIVNRKIN